ncbi:hypothetical protein [Mesorhizobium sp. M1322]|uniref:hypothetical protein n=1 Tax=Mesorhizobium sp. M1322 TaxID=2957081 RepID=UPI0033350DD7
MAKSNPIVDLTMFVRRRTAAGDEETGTGLLITPRLVMTALHVVCPFGGNSVVPAHPLLKLSVRFEIASSLEPGTAVKFYPARLVWPPPGASASRDFSDIALLALDNDGLDEGDDGYLPVAGVDAAKDLIKRYPLEEATRRIRLGVTGHRSPQVNFMGYPLAGEMALKTVQKAIGQEHIPPLLPIGGTVPLADPPAGKLVFLYTSQVWPPTPERPNPLVGISGASVYRVDDGGEYAEIYGVLNRSLSNDGAQSLLSVAPIPKPDVNQSATGFWSFVPEAMAFVEDDCRQHALEVIHRLDRTEPVQIYLDGFRNKRPRSYFYVFVTTSWDGPDALCKRLQEASTNSDEPLFDSSFALHPPLVTIQNMDGAADCPRLLTTLAKQIGARAPGESPAQPSIADRLASGAGPRLLLFDVDECRLFDEDTGERLEGAVAMLRQLMLEIAGWAKQELTPQGGISYQRENPLVAVLRIQVSSSCEARQAFKQAKDLARRTIALFQNECGSPEGMHCEVCGQPLDEISFSDFNSWCAQQFRTANFSGTLGNAMEPPFTGGTLRFNAIWKRLDALK